jgi:SAM-dependent methyltransferase
VPAPVTTRDASMASSRAERTATRTPGCRGCGADDLVDVLDLGLQPLREFIAPHVDPEMAPLVALACGVCGLLQLGPSDARDGAVRRPGGAGLDHGHGGAAHSTTVGRHVARFARELLDRARDAGIARPRIAQLDSGDGAFLARLAGAGASVTGFERDEGLAGLAQRAGVPTRPGAMHEQIAALAAEPGSRDVIVVSHVLAHLEDLDGAIAALARALAPDGILAIEFHHAAAIQRGQFDILSHAHRSYLTLVALLPILERHGLVAIDASTHRLHGGTVRVWAGHAGGRRPDAGVAELAGRERAAGLDRPDAYRGLTRRAATVGRRLRGYLAEARAARRHIAGYGAPGRGVTLLNFAGVGADDLPYTVDRDPAKRGCVMAGTGIAIERVDAITERRPDELLILPWPLAAEIRDQLAHLPWAGRTVVAMPRLAVA